MTEETAPLIRCRLVAEGANGPTTPGAERILLDQGIDVIPDILCNAGGVIVSFFEWLQNRASQYWTLEEVDDKLRKTILPAYENVVRTAKAKKTDYRTAAYAVGLARIAEAYKERGVWP